MKKLLHIIAVAVLGLGLTTGIAAASTDISSTGPDSQVEVRSDNTNDVSVENDNDARIDSRLDQDAQSGDAEGSHSTEVGSVTSGNADNEGSFELDASIDNSSSTEAALDHGNNTSGNGDVSIDRTGPDSDVTVRYNNENRIRVRNNNNIQVNNNTNQNAQSGDAEVSDSTEGGSVRSGNASNENHTSVSLDLSN